MTFWHPIDYTQIRSDFDRYIESFDICVRLEWMCDIMFGWEQSRLYHVIEAIQANAIDRVRCAYAVEYCVMRQEPRPHAFRGHILRGRARITSTGLC